jgi:2-methylcitrate dehydratase PrpD
VMDEMLRLIQQNNIQAADVEKVEVGGNLSNYRTLFQHRPTTGLQGKFSMEYAMAILLLERKATLSSFTDAVVQRPDVQNMIARVHYAVDPQFNKLELQGASLQAMLVEQSGLKIFRSHPAREGQPRKSHDLRRSSRQIPRQRRIREVAQAEGGVGHRAGEITRGRARHDSAYGGAGGVREGQTRIVGSRALRQPKLG